MPPLDPELAEEQAHIDRAYRCLAAMRERTARVVAAGELSATAVDSTISEWHLRHRLASLAESSLPLCFGRIDHKAAPGEQPESGAGRTFHIGRRHVEDGPGEEVVVDWRAPVSTPFYRATLADPMELSRRRRFVLEDRALVDIFEEHFDETDGSAAGGGVPDPLLAELGRARTGEMRDIVATIQAEQDVVIRAPLEELLVVQGGPGTGKTAVGLHRAAFLLYEHRQRLEEERVLVVGPNRIFLRYIAQVLPSLGETAVVQTTIDGLVGSRYRVRATDPPATARLKGDTRMAEVLAAACRHRLRPLDVDVELSLPWGRVRLAAVRLNELAAATLERGVPFNIGRDAFRRQVERLAARPFLERGDDVQAAVRADRTLRAAVDRAWPSLSAPTLVRQLLGNRRVLASAAAGLLGAEEQALLLRRTARRLDDEEWTEADLPLLDEAEALVAGGTRTYGHVVVDEAQDLSAMELRMLARRSPTRSMTVLGDLAQATEASSQVRWEDALGHLAAPAGARVEELTIGYRVPGPILDFANRLLPVAAPHVRASTSVRTTGDPPQLVQVAADGLAAGAAAEAAELADRFSTVGVIVPASLVAEVEDALKEAGVAFGDAREVGLAERVTVLLPPEAKGLEFDAVLVVEPGLLVAEETGGARMLYVALTRAVQHLTVLHEAPLPEPLAA